MRAAVITHPDTPPVCAEFPEPEGRPGQEPLRLVGAGIHNVVRGIASGRHYESTNRYPLVPGIDAVARTRDGRLVYTGFAHAPWGTLAERMITPFGLDVPEHADPLAVAAGINAGTSGWFPLVDRRRETGALGTVLVLGATGMSGSMAVQAAVALGAARVVAAGRDPEALEWLRRCGATTVSIADPDPDALAATLAPVVAETPPSLVLDYLWGPVAEAALTALGATGRGDGTSIGYVQIGSLAGEHASVSASLLRSRRIRLTGSGAGSVPKERMLAEIPDIIALIADGRLRAPYTAYPLSEIEKAWAHRGRDRAVVVPD
ncbi:NADPH:quinone reductase [Actinoplanes sp. NBRC 14428]|uniref:NADPH:quinone reductase-like Zn-dependent oxidoreductase n=1 Tax=Pseudosporangium ferrugineum TaxID=439699 RepID=A0A2T0SBG3_9ACTN|nr:zinc-binding alcohol dehydrogenase family protein [Pseudosporangium ferrugineum]PRY30767.1 NADPH:quinone reductase-like Zn-dependent oxidoreductase [Pseudosporangium ferrugineum]BCJ50321.1 NADPH:quinone reductase [Actinoplanes sp. NBRC 14428]